MGRSVRTILLTYLLILVSIMIGAMLLMTWHDYRQRAYAEDLNRILQLQSLESEREKELADFLLLALADPIFYQTGSHPTLRRYEAVQAEWMALLESLQASQMDAAAILRESQQQDSLLHQLVAELLLRGFEDYGEVGRMRDLVHGLEEQPELALAEVLMLRRHEKDYLLRHQAKYVERHRAQVDRMLVQLNEAGLPASRRLALQDSLRAYQDHFQAIVSLDQSSGRFGDVGLWRALQISQQAVREQFDRWRENIALTNQQESQRLRLLVWSILGGTVLLSILVSLLLARRATHRLQLLAYSMQEFVSKGFSSLKIPVRNPHSTNEIDRLVLSFNHLQTQLQEHVAEIDQQRLAAEQANRAKSSFLANMSHEIRTPLNGVIGTVQLMRDTPLNADQVEHLDTLDASSQNLLGIINDVLDLSRIEAGKLQLEDTPLDLRVEVKKVHQILRSRAREKGLDFSFEVDPQVPAYVMGDPLRLRQVLINLAGNAVKFTDRGSVRIEALQKSQGYFLFMVSDTGIGIAPEVLERLFAPFQQADDSTSRKFGGTGLGLSICRELVEMMQGSIWAESKVGEGTTFFFTAKLAPTEAPQEEPEAATPANLRPWKILVAEDHLINQKVIQRVLAKQRHEVVLAQDGQEAFDRYRQEPPDLILMDMQMPGVDGLAATEQIRQYEQKQSSALRVPIIALTANATPEDRRRCLAAGMDDYLTKPINAQKLHQIIGFWQAQSQPLGTQQPE